MITGISGAEYGIRGFIDGWDPETGKHLWRTYTVAGRGRTERQDLARATPGSTAAVPPGSPVPSIPNWTPFIGAPAIRRRGTVEHPGDNLYTCSILALEPKTGEMKWHYQFTPNDPYDYDSDAEMVLGELNIGGKPQGGDAANRNGFLYVLDRTSGKLIAANQYVTKQTWAKGIDMADRRSRPKSPINCAQGKGGRRVARGDGRARTGARFRSIPRPAWSMPTR